MTVINRDDEVAELYAEPPVAFGATMSVIRLADVVPERVSWLWHGYIPRGKLVTLDGDPGLGKSTFSLEVAATVTTGGQWPDGSRCEHPAGVLLLSAEDGLADTVRPRLDAAGADVSRVHAIEGVPTFTEDGDRVLRPPTLADIDALAYAITEASAALLIVDVLMAYLPSGADSHKDQDIRQVLGRLSKLADVTDCTVLLIRHLNKAKGGDPIYRGGGSIGIVGAARAGLLVAADPDDPERRILASVKSNLGPAPVSLAYRLVDTGTGVARVEWDGTTTHSAGELLRGPDGDADSDARTEAEHWLADYLAMQGEVRSDVVKRDAAKAMISERTLKRAMKSLGVGVSCREMPRRTFWRLSNGASSAEDPPGTQNLGPTGPTESDQHKQVGPTGPDSQSGHVVSDGPTGPPGGITASTPGVTDRVARILAKTRITPTAVADPACIHCGKPCVGKQQDPEGRPAHLGCITQHQPERQLV